MSERPTLETLTVLYVEQNLSAAQIAERFGVHKNKATKWVYQAGLRKSSVQRSAVIARNHRGRTEIDETQLRALIAQGLSPEKMADTFGCCFLTVYNRIAQLGIPYGIYCPQVFAVDLSKPYTPELAWFAGWVASDGHVRGNRVTVELQEKDVELLTRLQTVLLPDRLADRVRSDAATRSINLNDKKLATMLRTAYAIPEGAKSYTISMPMLPTEECYRMFVRGVFEGDGSLYAYKKGICFTIVSASERFIDGIIATIKTYTGVTLNKNIQSLPTGKKMFFARKYRPIEVSAVASWLYIGHRDLVLSRKFASFQTLCGGGRVA